MKKHLYLGFLSLLIGGCLSFQLPGGKITSAKDVVFKAPNKPFKIIKNPTSDKAWISEKTGNTVSFLSECGGRSDLSLEQIESESLSSLTNAEVISSEEITFDGRAARKSISHGSIDGIPVKLALLVYTKNSCNFTISYGGVERKFNQELSFYLEFLNNFRTP